MRARPDPRRGAAAGYHALAAAPLLLALAACSAPLEIGGSVAIGRRGLAWQARVAAHPTGWVRGSIDRDVDVGVGVARRGGRDAAWLSYLQTTAVAWRDRHPDDAATLLRTGAELQVDHTHDQLGGAVVSRLDVAAFLRHRDDQSAFWGETSAGLTVSVVLDDTLGPTLSLGAQLRLPVGAVLAIPDGI
ncbi:MAG: hypothetical protein IT379_07550 [Deltaproteobacteria bacterium]|nr:hypothetical protein [Deltaproteobacteria bacterium]